ncbi:MAG: hypothetical protein JXP73_15610 [Deltaproteobacteria bacterium]|nr:hypothetical protein [Deltaproteobacteria bacterium]
MSGRRGAFRIVRMVRVAMTSWPLLPKVNRCALRIAVSAPINEDFGMARASVAGSLRGERSEMSGRE